MDLQLAGKKVILTGGSRGLGFAALEKFVAEGADVAFCARDKAKVDEAAKKLGAHGTKVHGSSLDASDQEAYVGWLNSAVEQLGGCDVFIHNMSASGTQGGTVDWQLNYNLDIMGAVGAVETLTPHLEKSGHGSIVFMGSTAALETFVAPMAFNACKAALLTFSGQLSQALGPQGIRVNTICPGPTEFEGGNWETIKSAMPEMYEQTVASIPMGRLGAADDVANTMVFLASPAAAYTTGTNIVIDGGFTKRVQF